MGKLRASIVGELFLVTSVMASAEPQLTQAEARCCSTIVNDEKCLKCFDDLVSAKGGGRGGDRRAPRPPRVDFGSQSTAAAHDGAAGPTVSGMPLETSAQNLAGR